MKQLYAGNGFQCTNETCLVFGVGDADEIKDIHVTWPDGKVESLGDMPTETEVLVVEGTGASVLDQIPQTFPLVPRR